MKKILIALTTLCITGIAFAQQTEESQLRRDNFHSGRVAVMPDSLQIVYITPPDLLKATGKAVAPTAAQIVSVTDPALLKVPAGTRAVMPLPAQIINETPADLLKPKPVTE